MNLKRAVSTHQRWTQTDITNLRSRLQAGDSVPDIARAMSRLPDGIMSMAKRLQLKISKAAEPL